MKIKIPNKNYELIEFYETVATEIGYTDTSELHYDCTKINISEDIKKMILDDNNIKVNPNLNANEVEIFEGFIY